MSPELLSVLSLLTCSTGLSYSFIILSLGGIASGSLSVEDMLQSGGLDISFSPELSVFGLLLTHTHSLTGTPEVPDLSLTMYLSQLECSMQVWAVR